MMYLREISLPNINTVYSFHNKISKITCDIDLVSPNSKYCVDAKSIMGILSMDLTQPVIIKVLSDNPTIIAEIDKIIDEL